MDQKFSKLSLEGNQEEGDNPEKAIPDQENGQAKDQAIPDKTDETVSHLYLNFG
jgi:hypothetical protein